LTKNDRIDTKQLYYGIIADGIHLAESTIQLAISSNQDGCILVTDAITALGLGDGVHQFGDRKIKVENNKATVDGTNTLAGRFN
jgi:N-acetylglucosamine-6-phosphate deacetylase